MSNRNSRRGSWSTCCRSITVSRHWHVGAYRIELVVEGDGARLAIECDGDRYHPPDKLGEDMERQAVLERLGWTFVRIRGSIFFRDEMKAMKPVFERLDSLGIQPSVEIPPGPGVPPEGPSELIECLIRRAEELRRAGAQETEGEVLTDDSIEGPDQARPPVN